MPIKDGAHLVYSFKRGCTCKMCGPHTEGLEADTGGKLRQPGEIKRRMVLNVLGFSDASRK